MSHAPYRTAPDNPSNTQARAALARDAGIPVILDGRIKRERYESVTGSVATLARFARALRLSMPEAA
ncbi:hypothetical protein [Burkholderia sp. IDO3]|uniref:hypothetical protein n=1 Tax=Burkholderia sp. IDO3 TaxID=1705310 RepID=UPI000BBA59BC|nr:hypothetical protein [Burkholderia sp. IDO3]AXK67415.1 hypothetical protein DCN14_32825 [Burkholderia sp. IDO3]PCD60047.1 hypothetical protein CN645_19940 [Burkholderia sp. IDO3]